MPLYDVRCGGCGHTAEIFRSLAEFDALPEHCGQRMERVITAPRVMSDIEPYQAMGIDVVTGDAPMITSRSHHREYLRRNGYIERGDEPIRPAVKPQPTKDEIAQDVKRAIEQIGATL